MIHLNTCSLCCLSASTMTTRIQLPLEDMLYLDKLRTILGVNYGQPAPHPVQILPHVFLGSQRDAESLRTLRKIGITHVLNTAGFRGPREQPEKSPYEGYGIDYYEFKAEDNDLYNITQHFPESFRYLNDVKNSGGIALVHCALGINRSASVCVAYLMADQKVTLLKAVQTVKDKRRLCLTNKGFQIQLIAYARRKRLLDPLPPEQRDLTRRRVHFDDSALHYRASPPETGRYGASLVERPLHKYTEHDRDYRELYGRRASTGGEMDFFSRYIEGRMKDLSICTAMLCGNQRTDSRTYQPATKSSFNYDSKYSYQY